MNVQYKATLDFDGFAENFRYVSLIERLEQSENYVFVDAYCEKHKIHDCDEQSACEWLSDYVDYNFPNQKISDYYCQTLLDYFNQEVGTNLIFESSRLSNDYFMSGDTMHVVYNEDDYDKIIHYIKENDLIQDLHERIKDVTTVRSGYMPFYTYEQVEESTIEDDSKMLRCMFNVIMEHLGYESGFDSYWDSHACYDQYFKIEPFDIDQESIEKALQEFFAS